MRACLFILFLFVVACAAETPRVESDSVETAAPVLPPPPSIEQAAQIISASAELSDYQFTRAAISIPLQESAMTPQVRETARALQKAKWIGIDGDGNVVLTAKAKADKRFLLRQNGFIDIVPLAKKKFIGVTAVKVNPAGEPLASFRWKWVPNEIGTLVASRYSGEQQAVATLLWDGSAWTVLRIAP